MVKQSGQLLLEVLMAIAAVVILVVIGSQLVLVSQKSNVTAGHKDIALKLAEGALEAVGANAVESWQSIYDSAKGAGNLYHPVQAAGGWSLASGIESVVIDGITFNKSIYIENVNRDASGNIVLTGGTEDPSTQKITSIVSWSGGEPVTSVKYVSRYAEKSCVQTDWSGGAGGTLSTCPTTTFDTQDTIDTSIGGSIKLLME